MHKDILVDEKNAGSLSDNNVSKMGHPRLLRKVGVMVRSFSLIVIVLILVCLLPLATVVGVSLDEILLEDLIPNHVDVSACRDDESSTHTSFDFKTFPESRWSKENAAHEELAFLARMSHIDKDNPNRTWTASFGHGGNIYSWIGATFGEAIAPQTDAKSPWVDEVIQSVSVDSNKIRQDHKIYYIHQAGLYINDLSYMPPPFYSPNVAKTCSAGTCRFASWGQQAWTPTDLESNILYLHQYRNCGNGVLEYTQMVMNMNNGQNSFIDYVNVPWAGVRTSSFQQIHLSNINGTMKQPEPHIQSFGQEQIFYNLDQTGGYTTFSHTPPEYFLELPCAIPLSKQNTTATTDTIKYSCTNQDIESNHYVRLKLVVQANNTCEYAAQSSINQGGYVVTLQTHDRSLPHIGGCRTCKTKYGMKFINQRTGQWIHVPDIVWWSNGGFTYFKTLNVTDSQINTMFFQGDIILVKSLQPDIIQDKMALSYVHGVDEEYDDAGNREWMYLPMRLRYGLAGRDYTVFTVNARVTIVPGSTYMNRQYLINDQLLNIEKQANTWVGETFADMLHYTDFKGRTLVLYVKDINETLNHGNSRSTFGVAVENSTQSLCERKESLPRCVGNTTPKNNLKPFFYITCGDSSYLGPDLYFFSPKTNNTIRSYACNGMNRNIRPTWKLMGHFDDGCHSLINSTFDENFCILQ